MEIVYTQKVGENYHKKCEVKEQLMLKRNLETKQRCKQDTYILETWWHHVNCEINSYKRQYWDRYQPRKEIGLTLLNNLD